MDLWQVVVLSIIQGLTEFLPVSSSGHLILGSKLIGLPSPGLTFAIWVHVGTAFATVVMLRKNISWLIKGIFRPTSKQERKRCLILAGYIIAASIPAAIVGILFEDHIDTYFSSSLVASICLIVTGCILQFSKSTPSVKPTSAATKLSTQDFPLDTVTFPKSLIVGVSQAIAIIPGISRSGTTITAGLLTGMSREDSAVFSFLLSLPAVFGAAFLDIMQAVKTQKPVFEPMALLGGTISFGVGMIALAVLFRTIRKGELYKFSHYCWIVGILGVIVSLALG